LKPKFQRLKQPTPSELTDALLDFLRRKFYNQPGDEKCFCQDKSRLLTWVVLWPASWLNNRGVTIHGDAYREIFFKTFLQADAHRSSDRITYRPAWLRMVIQSHWKIHGEEYYEQAKSVRNLADHALLMAGKSSQARPDPVRELALAARLMVGSKRKVKSDVKAAVNLELKLS
jgi:hypothetical protein